MKAKCHAREVTSVDYLACGKDYQGKGVGSALAQSLNGPQMIDAWLLVSKMWAVCAQPPGVAFFGFSVFVTCSCR